LGIPIPKGDTSRGVHAVDSFRGINLSPVLSKIFENCILSLFAKYFKTSVNQFGFKPKLCCSHAIYSLWNVVNFYVNNDSTLYVCFLDMVKAFERLNNSVIYIKLMKRNVPAPLVKLLRYWYSISYKTVRWGDVLSKPYKLISGVRQGGVLSSVVFIIYVHNLLTRLEHFGCCFYGLSTSALLYADDLVLLASSVAEMQLMLKICCDELESLDLKINPQKSVVLRKGPAYKNSCCNLSANGSNVTWATEAKYLGTHLAAGRKFICNFEKIKIK